jgi:hypothetical protein
LGAFGERKNKECEKTGTLARPRHSSEPVFATSEATMPVYQFNLVPDGGGEPVRAKLTDDDAALLQARRTLREILQDAAIKGPVAAQTIEVIRDDGTVIGIAVPDEGAAAR